MHVMILRIVWIFFLIAVETLSILYAPLIGTSVAGLSVEWEGEMDFVGLAFAVALACLFQLLSAVLAIAIPEIGVRIRESGGYFPALFWCWQWTTVWYIVGVPATFTSTFTLLRIGLSPPIIFVGFLGLIVGGFFVALGAAHWSARRIDRGPSHGATG